MSLDSREFLTKIMTYMANYNIFANINIKNNNYIVIMLQN